ncbi:MAG: hypothetical protein AB7T49_21505 [Oligoflexales bacterium]
MKDDYNYLVGIIAAHSNHKVPGRLRLQKTVKLLQSLNFPTSYNFSIHFYGPYSEDLQSDIGLLECLGLIKEHETTNAYGSSSYVFEAEPSCASEDMSGFKKYIEIMEKAPTDALELAATYVAYKEMGLEHQSALESVRRKKKDKLSSEQSALKLLQDLRLLEPCVA